MSITHFAVWADGTFCESCDIENYMLTIGLSDDYSMVDIDDDVEIDSNEFFNLIELNQFKP